MGTRWVVVGRGGAEEGVGLGSAGDFNGKRGMGVRKQRLGGLRSSLTPPQLSRVWELTAGSLVSCGLSCDHPCSSFSRSELSGDLSVCLSGSSITNW